MQTDTQQSSPAIQSSPPLESVTVVITTFNDQDFLLQAVASVLAQEQPATEVLVVDDGSEMPPSSLLGGIAGVTLITKTNGGLASARNVGLRAARSRYICFLDADDLLKPEALAGGLQCFSQHPEAVMVYGGHMRIHANGSPAGGPNYQPVGHDPYANMLAGNLIGMHATVLYRRDALLDVGGYDEQLRWCEDYDLYLRIARDHPIASHSNLVAEYRWHGQNMSRNTEQMLQAALSIHEKHRPDSGPRLQAWLAGQRNWTEWYTFRQEREWGTPGVKKVRSTLSTIVKAAAKAARRRLQGSVKRIRARFGKSWPPRHGCVDFGSLASTVPASHDFGWDRGTPIDRYYVEEFLATHAPAIQGRVLEVGGASYCEKFGNGRIVRQDVLHVDAQHPTATLKGSLLEAGVIPENAFDCIIFTQTLQKIFELDAAVERLHAALKPGGVLLLTVPGISQIDRQEWREDWCWAFTVTSVKRLFTKHFPAADLEILTHGNVFAAVSFLFGVALEEIDTRKLDPTDPAYPCIITLRATKRV